MYKLSKYNYILTNFPETAILFNGLTKKFFLIKREKLAQYVNLLNSFQGLVDIPTPHLAILQKMIRAGFIVKENVDEFQQVRKREHDFLRLRNIKQS